MVTDIAPTLIDWIKPPVAPSDSKPMTGRSLLPVLRGDVETVYAHDDIRAIEVSGNTALYKGDYKITRSMPPAGDATWALFNMRTDPGETSDLREMEPEMLAEMLAAYDDYARQVGVLEMPEGYHSLEQILDNTTPRLLKQYRWHLVGIALLFLILAYAIYRGVRLLLKGVGT
ncbi:MAG: hypothetical protein AAFV59_10275 [Pseudomonadota bacterium]